MSVPQVGERIRLLQHDGVEYYMHEPSAVAEVIEPEGVVKEYLGYFGKKEFVALFEGDEREDSLYFAEDDEGVVWERIKEEA